MHPWSVASLSDEQLQSAVNELISAPVQVVGEIGLDYLRAEGEGLGGDGDRERQRAAFRAQLAVAAERRLPVIVHSVRAFEDAMKILSEFTLPTVVFHGFVGSAEQARRVVERGWFLSFGMRSFASPRTVEAMRSVPLDHVFLETDDDPTPIAEVYARAAEILEIPVNRLAEQTENNYKTTFL